MMRWRALNLGIKSVSTEIWNDVTKDHIAGIASKGTEFVVSSFDSELKSIETELDIVEMARLSRGKP